jgi:RNA polymerase sigma-70 factor (ECF subfamily)
MLALLLPPLSGEGPRPRRGDHDHNTQGGAAPVTAAQTELPAAGAGHQPPEAPIEAVCRLHARPLYRFLLKITFGDRREAEDLLQETLLRAWRYLQDHSADVTVLRPWLYTVARRAAIDAARARQARPAEVIPADLAALPAARDDIDRLVTGLTIRQALTTLTPDHRQVLYEIFYRGHTARQAATALGIPEGTVKSRTFYALRALAATITDTDTVRVPAAATVLERHHDGAPGKGACLTPAQPGYVLAGPRGTDQLPTR